MKKNKENLDQDHIIEEKVKVKKKKLIKKK